MLNAAISLANARWKVFPCIPSGRNAKAPLTRRGHINATTDIDQVTTWWTLWPDAMIGGRVPDECAVIDVDPRNNAAGFAELIDLVGELPRTLTVWSGRGDGGRHLYWRRPAGPFTSTSLPKGVDLKINGFCILPPSIHPVGQPYYWETHPIEKMPHTLQELIRYVPPSVRPYAGVTEMATSGLLRTVAEAQKGQRNRILFWAACRAAEHGVIDDIADDLVDAAVSAGETVVKARRTVASARKAAR
jgi:hypothetical protein